MAPWCPACSSLRPTWQKLAGRTRDLGIKVGEVDVTTSPGLSGRFLVTALPTIYHVTDGEFRQYTGPRDEESLVSFVSGSKWRALPLLPWYRDLSHSFRLSQVLRSIHNTLLEVHNTLLGSYTLIAVVPIFVGALLGLIVACIIHNLFPHRPQAEETVSMTVDNATLHPAPSIPVLWLAENYEMAEGVSLPHSTVYSHYLRRCGQHDLNPVNASSFGKLVHSVFRGLGRRRLGPRGNSKYYGIRVKPGSPLSSSGSQGEGGSTGAAKGARCGGAGRPHARQDQAEQGTNSHMHQHHQYLGDGNGAIPDFPDIQFNDSLPGDCTLEDVDTLKSIYREHCEAFLDAVLSLELSTVESLWREFWRQNNNNDSDECEEEKYLSKTKLYQLCGLGEVQRWVRAVDVAFYQRLVQVLLPDVLRPIPSPLTQAIRNFAKGLESWLVGAMGGCPAGMVRAKAGPAAALAQSLRRYTSLNHLAQAARAVLHNSQQIQQMLADLNRVDFHNVQEQASWVCQCSGGVVKELEADFKRTLQRQASLEQWAGWLETAVRRALRPHEDSPHYAHHARQFLLKWSFYSSMVIRDLTLRSAASFGSFHLIRLLYDEYMFYLIEHRVAAHQGSAPIQVMAERELLNGELEGEEAEEYEEGLGVGDVKLEAATPPKKMKIS